MFFDLYFTSCANNDIVATSDFLVRCIFLKLIYKNT
ncbi:hypothetical protein [Listeria phage 184]